jgi:ABC-2 type transport system permease protein
VDSVGKLGKIIRMEFRLTVANKVFLAMTLLGPFLIAAVTLLPGLLSAGGAMGGPVTRVALLGADPRLVLEIAPSLSQFRIDVTGVNGTLESVQSQVLSGRYDGYLALPADLSGVTRLEYVSRGSADFRVMGALQGVIGSAVVVQRLL